MKSWRTPVLRKKITKPINDGVEGGTSSKAKHEHKD